jgi:hypothetical protein
MHSYFVTTFLPASAHFRDTSTCALEFNHDVRVFPDADEVGLNPTSRGRGSLRPGVRTAIE